VRVVRCNGCGVDVDEGTWPAVTGAAVDSDVAGGAVSLRPGEEFDFCPLCTVVAFSSVKALRPLVQRMREQGLTGNEHQNALATYLKMGQLDQRDAQDLGPMADPDQSSALARRYGASGWRVAHVALSLLLSGRQAA
jgi:hypothetical protein